VSVRVDRGVGRLVAVLVAVVLGMGIAANAGTAPAFGDSSSVTVSISSSEYGTPTTDPLFGVYNVLDVQIAVANAGGAPSGGVTVADKILGARYVDGSASCGSSPGCTVSSTQQRATTLTFAFPSVPANATDIVTFQVQIQAGQLFHTISNVAHWTGDGCTKRTSCVSNRLKIPVYPSPVKIETSITGSYIQYSLLVHNFSPVEQDNIVVMDQVPDGTTYVDGSALCDISTLPAPTSCTASESGGVLTFDIGALPPRPKNPNHAPLVTLNFVAEATTSSAGGPEFVTNTATWVGDSCHFGPPCVSPPLSKKVVPTVIVVPTPTTVPRPVPTTTVPPVVAPLGTTTTSTSTSTTTTTTTTTPAPVSAPAAVRAAGPSLQLNPSSISPGGSTTASGSGCPAHSPVVMAVDGRQVSSGTADARGRFSINVSPGQLPVGRHVLTATCGSVVLSTSLNIVVTTSSSGAATPAEAGAAAFGVFVLLGVLLLRGQFDTNATRRRTRGRGSAEVLAEQV
jgi:uncharacterized repeat protein (TIGR01451 family)